MTSKSGTRLSEEVVEAAAVALLKSVGTQQNEIAKAWLGISNASVARRFNLAQQMEFAKVDISGIPSEVRAMAISRLFNDRYLRSQLETSLEGHARFHDVPTVNEVYVVNSVAQKHDYATWSLRLDRLSRIAAFWLENRVRQVVVEKVGISWGNTLGRIEQCLNSVRDSRSSPAFIPLRGDPISEDLVPAALSPSILAKGFADKLGGRIVCSLSAIPAWLSEDESDRLWGFKHRTDFKQIFGDERTNAKAMVHELDMILTGVGVVRGQVRKKARYPLYDSDPWQFGIMETIDEKDRLKVAGDIAGVFLSDSDDTTATDKLNSRTLGLQESHLAALASKSRANRETTGVVVVAQSRLKAPILNQVIRKGYANTLIIDDELAKELIEKYLPIEPQFARQHAT